MDYEFRQNETGTDHAEIDYDVWLAEVGRILGQVITHDTEKESDLFSFFSDDCTPQEAADEYRAQKALENPK